MWECVGISGFRGEARGIVEIFAVVCTRWNISSLLCVSCEAWVAWGFLVFVGVGLGVLGCVGFFGNMWGFSGVSGVVCGCVGCVGICGHSHVWRGVIMFAMFAADGGRWGRVGYLGMCGRVWGCVGILGVHWRCVGIR